MKTAWAGFESYYLRRIDVVSVEELLGRIRGLPGRIFVFVQEGAPEGWKCWRTRLLGEYPTHSCMSSGSGLYIELVIQAIWKTYVRRLVLSCIRGVESAETLEGVEEKGELTIRQKHFTPDWLNITLINESQ